MNMAISVILKFNMYDFEACPSGQKRPIGIFVFFGVVFWTSEQLKRAQNIKKIGNVEK